MISLTQLAEKYGTDKFEHGYCRYYEKHLTNLHPDSTLLEIGIATGASLRMWRDALPDCNIIGIDNNPDVKDIPQQGFDIIFGDATNEEDLKTIESVNIVIDDGSHHSNDIVKSFELLWSRLTVGGWYIIEDLGTQFNEKWGGNIEGSDATKLIYNELLNTFRKWGIIEFHAYEQIVFIRKGEE
jgi:SAM-dependent methyltransferase